jgi:hypothetical protein
MNRKFKILIKVTPFLSVLFILAGLTLAILGVLDHNLKTLTSSLLLISQSVLLLINTKLFKKIWKI